MGAVRRNPVKPPATAGGSDTQLMKVLMIGDVVGKPGRTVVAEAIVVRVVPDPDPGLGCRFFRITGGPRLHLEDCLKMLEQKV